MNGCYEERKRILKQAVNMEKSDRIPIVSHMFNWPIVDSGYTFPETFADTNKLYEVWTKVQEKYNFDSHYLTGMDSNYVAITEKMGGAPGHTITDYSVQVTDTCYINYDEMDAFAENPTKVYWETIIPRKYPKLAQMDADSAASCVAESVATMNRYLAEADGRTNTALSDTYHCFPFRSLKDFLPNAKMPIEFLYSNIRSIKNTSIDMRKDPVKYKEWLDKLAIWWIDKPVNDIRNGTYGTAEDGVIDFMFGMLTQNILNPKQFENFYWPHMNKIVSALFDMGKVVFVYVEGATGRFFDYMKDFPKSQFVIYSENDDIFEMRKQLPNACIFGGMPVYKLGRSTADDCIDYAKKLCDELGSQGGYIFSTDKMMNTGIDGTSENLLAVNNFVRDYK